MKRIISVIVCLFMFVSVSAFPSNAFISEAEYASVVGDVNGDGQINAIDASEIKHGILGDQDGKNPVAADVNGDSYVNSKDSYVMKSYFAELLESFVQDSGSSIDRILIDGVSIDEYKIVVPPDGYTNDNLDFAARELKKYINTACGADIPIVTEQDGSPSFVYMLDSLDGSGELRDDGVDITIANKTVYITGGTKRGCLYATYEFLERYLGFVFINDSHEYILENQAVQIDGGDDYRYVPAIIDRGCRTMSSESALTAVKWKNNSTKCSSAINNEKYGYGIETGTVHTMGFYTDCENDEYICYTKNAIFEEVRDNVLAKIASQKERGKNFERIIVGPMDNPGCCSCRNCAKLVREEKSYMGAQLTFVNKIADAVAEQYSDVNVMTTAYWYARRPPVTLKPRENVEIMYCWSGCNNHPFDGSSCFERGNGLWYNNIKESVWFEKWTEICDRVWVWLYCGSYAWAFAQPSMLDYMRENLAYLASHGIYGIYCEGEYGYPDSFGDGYSFDLLTMYMFARCNWDPQMTKAEYDAYILEFLELYYGDGAKYIKEYLDINAAATDAVEACWCNNFDRPFASIDPEYLAENAEKIIGLMDSALALCKTEDERDNTTRLAACVYWQCLAVTYAESYENANDSSRELYRERYERMYSWMKEYDMSYKVTLPENDEVQDPYGWTPWDSYNTPREPSDPMNYA